QNELADGRVLKNIIRIRARQAGVSRRALYRAKAALGVVDCYPVNQNGHSIKRKGVYGSWELRWAAAADDKADPGAGPPPPRLFECAGLPAVGRGPTGMSVVEVATSPDRPLYVRNVEGLPAETPACSTAQRSGIVSLGE